MPAVPLAGYVTLGRNLCFKSEDILMTNKIESKGDQHILEDKPGFTTVQ